MRKSEKELLDIKLQTLILIEKQIYEGVDKDEINGQLSAGFFNIGDPDTLDIVWLPKTIREQYEYEFENTKTDLETWSNDTFHPISFSKLVPDFLAAKNKEKVIPVNGFLYIRPNLRSKYYWVHTTLIHSKRLAKHIVLSHTVKDMEKILTQDERSMMAEQEFLRENYLKFLQLTQREKEVLTLLAQGLPNKKIADQLKISHHTVRTHRNNIHDVLGLRWKNVNHAVLYVKYAITFGLV